LRIEDAHGFDTFVACHLLIFVHPIALPAAMRWCGSGGALIVAGGLVITLWRG